MWNILQDRRITWLYGYSIRSSCVYRSTGDKGFRILLMLKVKTFLESNAPSPTYSTGRCLFLYLLLFYWIFVNTIDLFLYEDQCSRFFASSCPPILNIALLPTRRLKEWTCAQMLMGIRGALQYVRYPIGQELPLHPLLLLYQPIPIGVKQFP